MKKPLRLHLPNDWYTDFPYRWHRSIEGSDRWAKHGVGVADCLATDFFQLNKRYLSGQSLRQRPYWLRRVLLSSGPWHEIRQARPPELPDEEGFALVICEAPTTSFIETLGSVIRAFSRTDSLRTVLVSPSSAVTHALKARGYNPIEAASFVPIHKKFAFMRRARQVAFSKVKENECRPDFIQSIWKEGLSVFAAYRVYELYVLLEFLHRISEKYPVRHVVSASDVHPFGRTATKFARTRKMRTFVLQHGLYPTSNITVGFFPPIADRVLVWGLQAKKRLMDLGVDESRIAVTGQPRFDVIPALRAASESFKDDSSFLFASQMLFQNPEVAGALLDYFALALDRCSQLKITIKLHPAEDPRVFRSLIERRRLTRITITKDGDLYEMLARCFAAGTVYSTVGLEALIFGSPLLVFSSFERSHEIPYVLEGVGVAVQNPDAFVQTLAKIRGGWRVSSKIIEDFVSEHAFRIDGCAGERIRSVILDSRNPTCAA